MPVRSPSPKHFMWWSRTSFVEVITHSSFVGSGSPRLVFPHPHGFERCTQLITHFAVVFSAAEVLGKVKRPKGEELTKLACLAVFCNDSQDLRKQPGGIRVRIE